MPPPSLAQASGDKVSETVRATHPRRTGEASSPHDPTRPGADQVISRVLGRRCATPSGRHTYRMRNVVERRDYERSTLGCDITCIRDDRSKFAARAVDISLGGMRIQSQQAVQAGEHLTIFAVLPGGAETLRLPATVRWQRPGTFGVQFVPLHLKETLAVSRHIPNKV